MAITTSSRLGATKTYLEPGAATTCVAGAAVTAGKFVKVTAQLAGPPVVGLGNHPRVIHTTAGTETPYGVAHTDAADTAEVSVLRAGTVGVIAGEALASGDVVTCGAAGVAMKAGSNPVRGVCTADTANAAMAPITLYL